MRLVWTRQAARDRNAIREYVARDNPAAALALDELFSEKAASLCDYPALGRTGRVRRHPRTGCAPDYILIYDTTIGMVRILRVLHAARQWPQRES